jgi:hypothetical protein
MPSVQYGGERLYITPFSFKHGDDKVCYYHCSEFQPMGGSEFEWRSEFSLPKKLWYKLVGASTRLFGYNRLYLKWWVIRYVWDYTIPFVASEIYDDHLGLPFTLMIGVEQHDVVQFQYLCPTDAFISKKLTEAYPFPDTNEFKFSPDGPLCYVDDSPEYHDENVRYQKRKFEEWRKYKAWEYTQQLLGRQISYIVELDT